MPTLSGRHTQTPLQSASEFPSEMPAHSSGGFFFPSGLEWWRRAPFQAPSFTSGGLCGCVLFPVASPVSTCAAFIHLFSAFVMPVGDNVLGVFLQLVELRGWVHKVKLQLVAVCGRYRQARPSLGQR